MVDISLHIKFKTKKYKKHIGHITVVIYYIHYNFIMWTPVQASYANIILVIVL